MSGLVCNECFKVCSIHYCRVYNDMCIMQYTVHISDCEKNCLKQISSTPV